MSILVTEESREIEAFFAAQLTGATPLLTIGAPAVDGNTITATYGDERPLRSAALVVTPDTCRWPEREWHVLSASTDPQSRQVSAVLPNGVTAAAMGVVPKFKL